MIRKIIVAWKTLPAAGFTHDPFGAVEIERVRSASQLLEQVAGVDANGVGPEVIDEGEAARYVNGAVVTGTFFEVLGVEPVLGRALTSADDIEGAEPVLVISHGLWQRRYGGSRDVIGRRVALGDQRFSIVGVMPPDVDYPAGVEAWRTTHSVPTSGPFGDAARREIDLLARLRPGVTLEQATSRADGADPSARGRRPQPAPRVVPFPSFDVRGCGRRRRALQRWSRSSLPSRWCC